MKIKWSRRALADQQQIVDFYSEIDVVLALDMIDRIDATVENLLDFPQMGRPGRVPDSREWPIKKTPFIAICTAGPREIRLLRLLHGAMKWPSE